MQREEVVLKRGLTWQMQRTERGQCDIVGEGGRDAWMRHGGILTPVRILYFFLQADRKVVKQAVI